MFGISENSLFSNRAADQSSLCSNLHSVDETDHHRTNTLFGHCHSQFVHGMQVKIEKMLQEPNLVYDNNFIIVIIS